MRMHFVLYVVLSAFLVATSLPAAEKIVLAEIVHSDGSKLYQQMNQEEYKALQREVQYESDAMPYAHIRTQIYWRTNVMHYGVKAGEKSKGKGKSAAADPDARFNLDRPAGRSLRTCGMYDDPAVAAERAANFSSLEAKRKEQETREKEEKLKRLSEEKKAELETEKARIGKLQKFLDAQLIAIIEQMKAGKFREEKEVMVDWQGREINRMSIPKRLGDGLDSTTLDTTGGLKTGGGSLDKTSDHLTKPRKKLGLSATTLVNTAEKKKAADEKENKDDEEKKDRKSSRK